MMGKIPVLSDRQMLSLRNVLSKPSMASLVPGRESSARKYPTYPQQAEQACGEYLVEFHSNSASPYPVPGDLILLNFGEHAFSGSLPGAIDPLYFKGDDRILAQIAEIETQGKNAGHGKARIFGTAPVSLSSSLSPRGRRFALPAGNGSWVYSKRGGARLLPRVNGQSLVSLGPFETAPDLYTGPFTVDWNAAGTEILVYDSAADSSSRRAGFFSWVNSGSPFEVPNLTKTVSGAVQASVNLYAGWNGSSMSFSLSGGLTSSQAQTGVEIIELAIMNMDGGSFQVQHGNIYLPWRAS